MKLLFLLAAATAQESRTTLWDATNKIPNTWTDLGPLRPPSSTEIVTFHVALTGANKNVEDILQAVSDPRSQQYGKYYTIQQLQNTFQAPTDIQMRVESFFANNNATCISNGASLKCTTQIPTAEALFQTEFHAFTHKTTKTKVINHIGTLSLPSEISKDIDFVSGLGQFMASSKHNHISSITAPTLPTSNCGGSVGQNCFVTPETMRTLYNISDDTLGSSSTSVGVAEFGGNYNIGPDSDLSTFGTDIAANTKPLKINQRGGIAASTSGRPSEEAELDIQYTSGMADGVTNWVWNQQNWMYALCQDLQNATSRPSVISMSYAWAEDAQCSGTTGAECKQLGVNASAYVTRTNQEFAKVGLLGITLLSASGDSGCHGRTEGICVFQKEMKPAYPASSPYVTSVGGTMLHDGVVSENSKLPVCQTNGALNGKCAGTGREVVSSTGSAGGAISSGGGFAGYSPRPSYQNDVVETYLNNQSAMAAAGGKGTLFNANGRGYPDISALAHKMFIVMGGSRVSVDGTSAASPSIAGIVGLINSARLKNGKPVVGFLNPLLYTAWNVTKGAAFNDITEGSNACTEEGCWCKTGFNAAKGWDASTGLGSPNVGKLMDVMDQLDSERE